MKLYLRVVFTNQAVILSYGLIIVAILAPVFTHWNIGVLVVSSIFLLSGAVGLFLTDAGFGTVYCYKSMFKRIRLEGSNFRYCCHTGSYCQRVGNEMAIADALKLGLITENQLRFKYE